MECFYGRGFRGVFSSHPQQFHPHKPCCGQAVSSPFPSGSIQEISALRNPWMRQSRGETHPSKLFVFLCSSPQRSSQTSKPWAAAREADFPGQEIEAKQVKSERHSCSLAPWKNQPHSSPISLGTPSCAETNSTDFISRSVSWNSDMPSVKQDPLLQSAPIFWRCWRRRKLK